jgi:hypothetical protein
MKDLKHVDTFKERMLNESLDINKLDKDVKKYIQNLQTERNLYKKCLGKIFFDIEHLKKDVYDYGEASEELLNDIKEEIQNITCKVDELKEK